MGRTAYTKLDSPAARRKLAPRDRPYTLTVGPRPMLGYVRTAVGNGRWLPMLEIGRTSTGVPIRRRGDIGLADDVSPADGKSILTYAQVLPLAASWEPEGVTIAVLKVRDTVEPYVAAIR